MSIRKKSKNGGNSESAEQYVHAESLQEKMKRTKNLTAKEEPKAKEKCKLMRGSATKKGGKREMELKKANIG